MARLRPALVLTLLALPVALPATTSTAAPGDPVLDVEEKAFCKQINQYRQKNRLPTLKVSVSLTNAAKWMSADMASHNTFNHTDNLGRSFSQRLGAFGYTFNAVKGENIAAGSAGATGTMGQWKTSSGHNRSMLSSQYKVIGIGRAYSAGSTYRWYWTTDFGSHVDRTMPC